jgi:hypothetical protein
MLLAHLHFLRRDSPLGIVAVQINLGPLRMTQFTGTHEKQRRELQGVGGDEVPGIPVNGSEQLAYARGFGDRSVVLTSSEGGDFAG